MFLEFTQIEENLPKRRKDKDRIAPNGMRIPWYNHNNRYSFWAQFFYCECGHIYYNHNFDTGKCDAEYYERCDCTKLVFCVAQMEIVFTVADVFEEGNPDHSERDSLQWWIEFGEWYEKQNKTALV